ncbi:hypothetical protein EG829_00655 [bacterium]|nr:hypothetical protein [bacterium]
MANEKHVSAESHSAGGTAGNDGGNRKIPRKSLFMTLVRHWRSVGVVALLFMVAGNYVWKNIAVSRAKAQLNRQAGQVISEQNRSYLRLAAVPLVWVVRGEMMRGNYDQVNQYLAQFVREPNMKEIVVARTDGRIVAATNKQREGAPATDFFPPEVLRTDSITVTSREDGGIMVAAPVMGLNDKLGVLILVASPPAYSLDTPSR